MTSIQFLIQFLEKMVYFCDFKEKSDIFYLQGLEYFLFINIVIDIMVNEILVSTLLFSRTSIFCWLKKEIPISSQFGVKKFLLLVLLKSQFSLNKNSQIIKPFKVTSILSLYFFLLFGQHFLRKSLLSFKNI